MMVPGQHDTLNARLQEVRGLMAQALADTVLRHFANDCKALVGSGKMLRSRLVLQVGEAAGVPGNTLLHAAAAVEMIHAASLLHDDVIDGGFLRRGVPTFWVERGVPGAILVGDLMLFKALELVSRVEDSRLTRQLIRMTGEVCDAESEQELLLRNTAPTWENCLKIARRKTGALFAFAAFACGGTDEALSQALNEAGYIIGTAYQLADDILDAKGTPEQSGKSHGSDHARHKTTAVTANTDTGRDPIAYVEDLCRQAEALLAPWPAILTAWREFMTRDMQPALYQNLQYNPS
ncbi:MAG TPA: polyprenyl synthetase family protein [Kiritimatiellia bacterium]|nr:polyprenyl synthetase family protein [Kiritimatiellia bacterium]HMO98578.1 polyprenyl synthetase family protein [Kiritimatiellia bacterium]HMP95443.1 polyprenyl synthetase family protein [Kiritimatiellia bacterium]